MQHLQNGLDHFEGAAFANDRTPCWWQLEHAETCRRCTNAWNVYTWVHVKSVLQINFYSCTYVLKLSQWQNSIKYSWTNSRIRWFRSANVSQTDSIFIIRVLICLNISLVKICNLSRLSVKSYQNLGDEGGVIPEMSVGWNRLTWLSAQEDFIWYSMQFSYYCLPFWMQMT